MLLSKNKKAFFNNLLLEKYTAGIVLKGYEVKAIREGKVGFEGSYIQIKNGSSYIVNLYIGKYSKQSFGFKEEDTKRDRQLLLNKREIEKIEREISQKGKTAVPTALVMENGKVKVEFAVVKGKKEYEKKQTVKDRQADRDLAREAKDLGL